MGLKQLREQLREYEEEIERKEKSKKEIERELWSFVSARFMEITTEFNMFGKGKYEVGTSIVRVDSKGARISVEEMRYRTSMQFVEENSVTEEGVKDIENLSDVLKEIISKELGEDFEVKISIEPYFFGK